MEWDPGNIFSLRNLHVGKCVQNSEQKALSVWKMHPRPDSRSVAGFLAWPEQREEMLTPAEALKKKKIKKQKIIIPFPAKNGSAKISQTHLS